MNPTSQIKLPNNQVLDLKDADARNSISNLDQRVTALENAPVGGAGKFILFNGERLHDANAVVPDVLYYVDENNNALGRFLLPDLSRLRWGYYAEKNSVNISSGIHEMNLGRLDLDPDLKQKTYQELYPNTIFKFDSLCTDNSHNPEGFYKLDKHTEVLASSFDGPLYSNSFPGVTGKFLYIGSATTTTKVGINYEHSYTANHLIYQKINNPANQIYLYDLTYHSSDSYISLLAHKALSIVGVELYNENTNIFESCTLYNNADYNSVSDSLFNIHWTGSQQTSAYVYKFKFANDNNTYWTIITSRFKLHA